jgi:hypothetical protein
MESVVEVILGAIPNVGDVTTYPELLEAVPAENRAMLPDVLRELKRQGTISKGIFFEDGVNHYRIKREVV